jgi:adenylate cyclase
MAFQESGENPSSPPTPVVEEDVRAELQRILASPEFLSQKRLQNFLVYVVTRTLEGRAAELKEQTIGCDVFERRADFDAKIDSIVRVQARRLREKLNEYY